MFRVAWRFKAQQFKDLARCGKPEEAISLLASGDDQQQSVNSRIVDAALLKLVAAIPNNGNGKEGLVHKLHEFCQHLAHVANQVLPQPCCESLESLAVATNPSDDVEHKSQEDARARLIKFKQADGYDGIIKSVLAHGSSQHVFSSIDAIIARKAKAPS